MMSLPDVRVTLLLPHYTVEGWQADDFYASADQEGNIEMLDLTTDFLPMDEARDRALELAKAYGLDAPAIEQWYAANHRLPAHQQAALISNGDFSRMPVPSLRAQPFVNERGEVEWVIHLTFTWLPVPLG